MPARQFVALRTDRPLKQAMDERADQPIPARSDDRRIDHRAGHLLVVGRRRSVGVAMGSSGRRSGTSDALDLGSPPAPADRRCRGSTVKAKVPAARGPRPTSSSGTSAAAPNVSASRAAAAPPGCRRRGAAGPVVDFGREIQPVARARHRDVQQPPQFFGVAPLLELGARRGAERDLGLAVRTALDHARIPAAARGPARAG